MEPHFRFAQKEDAPLVYDMIRSLARYEGLDSEVVASVDQLERTVFDGKQAEVLLVEAGGETVGFALFFHNYSTFLCRHGLYIEDLYIKEEYRNLGYGRATMAELCRIAGERGCGRVEWWCLDTNKPAIDFYMNTLGARAMDEWTVYRLDSKAIDNLVRN